MYGVARDPAARPGVVYSGLTKAIRGGSLDEGDQDRGAHQAQGRSAIAELGLRNGRI